MRFDLQKQFVCPQLPEYSYGLKWGYVGFHCHVKMRGILQPPQRHEGWELSGIKPTCWGIQMQAQQPCHWLRTWSSRSVLWCLGGKKYMPVSQTLWGKVSAQFLACRRYSTDYILRCKSALVYRCRETQAIGEMSFGRTKRNVRRVPAFPLQLNHQDKLLRPHLQMLYLLVILWNTFTVC